MKAPITSALSMAAILATGGAALTVNATVLDPRSESTTPSSEAQSPGSPSVPTSDPNPFANEFQIPGIGLVTMSTIGGILELDTVEANEGISYTVTETAPGVFEITFDTPDQTVRFTARIADGQIVTEATATSKQPSSGQTSAQQTPVTQPAGGGSSSGSGGGGSPSYDSDDDSDYDYDDDYDDDGFDFDDDDDHDGGDDD